MRTALSAGSVSLRQEGCVNSRDFEVVGLDRQGGQEPFNDRAASFAVSGICHGDSGQKFRGCDCGHGDIVIVGKQVIDP